MNVIIYSRYSYFQEGTLIIYHDGPLDLESKGAYQQLLAAAVEVPLLRSVE